MKALPSSLICLVFAVLVSPFTGCMTCQPQSSICGIRDSGGPAIPETFTGTVNRTRKPRTVDHVVKAIGAETGCCKSFDRVVFDFEGSQLPPYTVQYVTGPTIACRTNEAVPIEGAAKLKITFDEAQAHTPAQQPLFANPNRKLNCPNLKHLAVVCDFEGLVEVVLGLDAKKPYRVVELPNDSKLVIDIQH